MAAPPPPARAPPANRTTRAPRRYRPATRQAGRHARLDRSIDGRCKPVRRTGGPHKQNKGAADRSAAPSSDRSKKSYFRFVIAVRSAESLTMPVAPHQFELVPSGLLPVTVVAPTCALKAPVKTLQSPFDRLVSE